MNQEAIKSNVFLYAFKTFLFALKLAHKLGIMPIIELLRRPEWLYRSKYPVFGEKHYLSSPKPITDDDVALANRLITAWQKADAHSNKVTGVWGDGNIPLETLLKPLREANAAELAGVLTNMFHSEFIQGMSHGRRHSKSIKSRIIVPLLIVDRLVSLAEAIGVVQTETCEQGECGLAIKNGLHALIQKVEKELDISLDFPKVGAPSGILADSRLLTMRQMEHIYAAYRINRAIALHLNENTNPVCIEIGGGYGGLALWFLKMRKMQVKSYTLIDLPWVNVLQGYFLGKLFGAEQVSLYGESEDRLIRVLPPQSIDLNELWSNKIDIVINQDSMPEMPHSVVVAYLNWIKKMSGSLFYSYQQEAGAFFQDAQQVWVRETIKQVGGFHFLSRDYSWMRRGYTEEVYRINHI